MITQSSYVASVHCVASLTLSMCKKSDTAQEKEVRDAHGEKNCLPVGKYTSFWVKRSGTADLVITV